MEKDGDECTTCFSLSTIRFGQLGRVTQLVQFHARLWLRGVDKLKLVVLVTGTFLPTGLMVKKGGVEGTTCFSLSTIRFAQLGRVTNNFRFHARLCLRGIDKLKFVVQLTGAFFTHRPVG